MIKLNEESETVVSVYDQLKAKSISSRAAKNLLSPEEEKWLSAISSPSETTKAPSGGDNNLLDLDSPTLQSKSSVSAAKDVDLFAAFPSSSVGSGGASAVVFDPFATTQPAVFNDPFAPQPPAAVVTKVPVLADPFAGQILTAASAQPVLARPLQPPPSVMHGGMPFQMQPNPNFAQQGVNPMQYPPQAMIQQQYPYAYPPAGYPAPAPAPYLAYHGQPGLLAIYHHTCCS